MDKKYTQVNVNFRARDLDLLYWIRTFSNGNESKVGRDAFECYRLCRQIYGENWRKELENLLEIARAM